MSVKVNGIRKLTDLTAATTINDADVFMIETSSGSRKVTGAILKTLINNAASTAADGVTDIIGAEFDANESYSAGDYVVYNGKLYKFTDDHATGAFDGTDAEEVTVADEMVSDVMVNGTSVVSNGIANIPKMSNTVFGVAKAVGGSNGIIIDNGGSLRIEPVGSTTIKAGTGPNSLYMPITAYYQHESTFYGLAKAAGDITQSASSNTVGQYTDEAKAAIKSMLGIDEGIEVVRLA